MEENASGPVGALGRGFFFFFKIRGWRGGSQVLNLMAGRLWITATFFGINVFSSLVP